MKIAMKVAVGDRGWIFKTKEFRQAKAWLDEIEEVLKKEGVF